ncbi:SDR family oxidoreductase [Spongiactinospora sp. TRM90649]|nr:SDR family NAD(P)-dependent oxidoreductase [Spongiactinospora sp. TRM90649]MDF5753185.1 SDR family oxidoreductase [Spongiactinospora sp. TRM90649]
MIVTGAGGGIGAAVAECVAAAGYGVVVSDLGVSVDGHDPDRQVAESVVERIRSRGGRAVAHQHDVVSFDAAADLVRRAVEEFGSLDGLVTCHGILRERMIFNMTEDEWDSVIAVHLKGTFNCVRFATEQMRRQRAGSIVLLSSAAGMEGSPAQANYAAAKAGVVGLAQSTALAMGRYGVNVNCVVPSAATRMTSRLNDRMQGSRPDGERQGPELIAALIRALLDPANQHITGQTFTAAGRRLARWEPPAEQESVRLADEFTYSDVTSAIQERLGATPLRRFAALGLPMPEASDHQATEILGLGDGT